MITMTIAGRVFEAETGLPLPGLRVQAYDNDLLFDDFLGEATTDFAGQYSITFDLGAFTSFLDQRPDIYLRILAPDTGAVLFSTEDAVKWNASPDETCDVAVPREALGPLAPARTVELVGDDATTLTEIEIGVVFRIRATGLVVAAAHDISLFDDAETRLFTARLLADARGRIRDEVIWPRVGLDNLRTGSLVDVDEALSTWGGRTLRLTVAHRGNSLFDIPVPISPSFTRPLVISTDAAGHPRNALLAGSDELVIAGYNFPPDQELRVFVIDSQFDRRVGDSLGTPRLQFDTSSDGQGRFSVAPPGAGALAPASYDIVVREIVFGQDDNEALVALERDVIGSRALAGFTIRGNSMAGEFVPDGAAKLHPISGRAFASMPYFQHSDVFEPGEEIWAALDPSLLDPQQQGKMAALYLVAHKSASSWSSDPGLSHLEVLGGNAAVPQIMLQGGSGDTGMHLIWSSAEEGEYDIVADLGNNTTSAADFLPDSSFDQALDVIDGYVVAGFRVVQDPAVITEFENCGSFSYDEPAITVTDETGTYDRYNDETPSYSDVTVPVRGIVYFPADVPGATAPEQISSAQAVYPIFVMVHGNSNNQQSYLGYNYLLEHVARNGFIAASIHLDPDMKSRGRAEMLFHHLDRLKETFESRAEDRIAIMGHSRGGEAVVRATKESLNPAVPHTIEAVISLAPTDQYGRLLLGEAAARPYLVIYGSHDGDVAGAGAGSVPRKTGFSLHDRAYGAPKSMVFVYGALHGPFNTEWGQVDLLALPASDWINVITQPAHRTVALAYVTAFLRRYILEDTQYDGVIRGDWIPASVQRENGASMQLYVQYQGLDRFAVDSMVGNAGADGWTSSTVGGTVTDDGSLPSDPVEDWLHQIDDHSPHESGGLRLRWNGTQDRLRFELPEPRNVSGFSYLSFRVTQVVDAASNPDGPQDFFVSLRDQDGRTRRVRVGQFAEIPEPAEREDKPGWLDVKKSAMRTVRIPLTAFRIAVDGAEPVNLISVVEVGFHFGALATGEIVIDTIVFADGALPPDDILPPAGIAPPSEIARPQALAAAPAPAKGLPEEPREPIPASALRWEAREVVREIDGRARLMERLTLHGPGFTTRALEPIVRAGDKVARIVATSDDGLRLHAYFDGPIPDGAVIDYGYEDEGILYRFPEPFERRSVERLDRSRIPKDVIAPYPE